MDVVKDLSRATEGGWLLFPHSSQSEARIDACHIPSHAHPISRTGIVTAKTGEALAWVSSIDASNSAVFRPFVQNYYPT